MVKNTASRDVQKSLEDAFQIFHDFADNLTESYRTLEERIGQLNQELVDAEQERLAQLNEKERIASRLSSVLSALPAGVVVIDGRGMVAQANPVSVSLLGKPLEGELWRDIIQRAFTGEGEGTEMRLQSGRVVSVSTCPLGLEPGQIIHMVDVTETRALQDALSRYKRLSAMGEMTAKLAHQIRTPLSSALLYTSQLAKGGLDEASQKKFSEKAVARLKHLEKVVEDMLAFTRGSGKTRKLVSVNELLDTFKKNCEYRLEESHSQLTIQPTGDELCVYVNPDAVLSVMQNLADNAIQACGEQAQLQLQVREVSEHSDLPSVDLIFSDNGPGIPQENLDNIFEPYFTTRAQGTGLGLAIARSVVQGHGGNLWVADSSDQGTTFVMRLPIQQEMPEEMSISDQVV